MSSMSDFRYLLPTRIEFGGGISATLPQELGKLGAERVFLISDEGVNEAGLLGSIQNKIGGAAQVETFLEVEPNPREETVKRAGEQGRQAGADTIVALGGGSVIDLAKAAAVLMSYGGDLRDYEGRGAVPGPVLPLIAIPTTAGTGSEVTFSSVITDPEKKVKFSLNSPYLAPRVALLDPQLTLTMPKDLTAATGIDALTHAIEGMTATRANPISDALGLRAVELIWESLPTAFDQGQDIEARSNMLLGSLLAGMCFSNSDVGGVHCMAESLGGLYDAPHGLANSIFLPEVLEFNAPYIGQKMVALAGAMGIRELDQERASIQAVKAIRELRSRLGIPGLSDLGVAPGDLDQLADMAYKNGSNPSNPRPMTREDYLELYRKTLEQ